MIYIIINLCFMKKSEEIFDIVNNNISKISMSGFIAHKEIMINQSFNMSGTVITDIIEIIDIMARGHLVATLKREQVPEGVYYTVTNTDIILLNLINDCIK